MGMMHQPVHKCRPPTVGIADLLMPGGPNRPSADVRDHRPGSGSDPRRISQKFAPLGFTQRRPWPQSSNHQHVVDPAELGQQHTQTAVGTRPSPNRENSAAGAQYVERRRLAIAAGPSEPRHIPENSLAHSGGVENEHTCPSWVPATQPDSCARGRGLHSCPSRRAGCDSRCPRHRHCRGSLAVCKPPRPTLDSAASSTADRTNTASRSRKLSYAGSRGPACEPLKASAIPCSPPSPVTYLSLVPVSI